MDAIDEAEPLAPAGLRRNVRLARACAFGALAIGGLSLTGWAIGIQSLKSLLPGLVTMKPNAALGLVLSAAALALAASDAPCPSWRAGLSRVCAGLAGLLGLLTLGEYSSGTGSGVDGLLFVEPSGALLTTHPGRMSIAAAAEFSMLGSALLLIDLPGGRSWAQGLSTAALLVSGLVFCGYACDIPALYQIGAETPMAVHTAAGFALLAAGALFVRLDADVVGRVTRRYVYSGMAVALALTALISLGVYRRMMAREAANRWVIHTLAVLASTRDLLSDVVEAESCSRGVAISGDVSFREHFRSDRAHIAASLDELWAAVGDNPEQQRRFSGLRKLIAEKLVFTEQTVAVRDREGKAAALALIATGRGRVLMDSIRAAAGRFEAEEQKLLRRREAEARVQVSRTLVSLFAGSLATIALVSGCLFVLLCENDLRRLNEDRVARLNKRLERHARFFSLSVDMFCLAGADGYFKEVSPTWEDTLGWSAAELLARPYLDLVHPEDRTATQEKASGLSPGDVVTTFENRYRCKDGTYKWLQWNSVLDAGSGLVYAVTRDISARKRAEHGMQETNKELEAFTYSVSHDLRAPLRAITGFSRMLADRHAERLDAEGHRLLGVVCANAAKMARLIDDLLAFSRLGRRALTIGRVDMAALARSVAEDIVREKTSPALRLTVGDLPATDGDASLLRQVFVNLIGNAVKYSAKKAAPVVEVGAENVGDETAYFVKDNGAGFDMRYAGKLFGVFQRLHAADEFEGTGVGLALVERVIRRHGGRVWGEGKVGEGAVFRFTLPRRKEESHE